MESVNEIFNWLSEHEAGFSALAALVVIVGVVLSPLGAGLRALLSGNKKTNAIAAKEAQTNSLSSANSSEITVRDFRDTPPPLITDQPSIAVLPFVNMSKDEDKEFFADGMTEDIITGLSCDSRLFVVARNSTFAYKGQSPDIRRVGEELGARYVLEGSIRPIGERLRITAQLIEAATGMHVWSEKVDRPVAELFDVMDEVVDSLVTALCANLGVAESHRTQRQRPEDLQAWALCVQSEVAYFTQPGRESILAAEKLARQAADIEPGFALSWALLAYLTSVRIAFGMSNDLAEDSASAQEKIRKALQLAPNDPTVLGYCGYAAIWVSQQLHALDYLERSIAINPNNTNVLISYGAALWAAGRPKEAAAHLEAIISRFPKDPFLPLAYLDLSLSYLVLGDFQQAEQAARNTIKYFSRFNWGYLVLAMSLAALEQSPEAIPQLEKMQALDPEFTRQNAEDFLRHSLLKPDHADTMVGLLNQAWQE